MKISNIEAFPVSYAIPEEYQVSLGIGRSVKRDAVIVKVTLENGTIGWGEAHAARAPTVIAELINTTLRQLVLGYDATDTAAVWRRVYRMQIASHGTGAAAAIGLSGIDLALWDCRGKLAQKPVYALLGGERRRVAAYAGGVALGYQAEGALCAEIDTILARGYTALKLRLGDTPDADCRRLRAARDHAGPNIDLLTDVNAAYDLAQVAAIMPTLDECAAAWLEEPFPPQDYMGYRAARRLGRTPLAAGENHYTRFDFERVADDGAITIWQPDLSKCGGLSEALVIARLAADRGVQVHPHTSVSALNMAASIHFLSAVDNAGYFEADVSRFNPLRRTLTRGGFLEHDDGTVEALDAPGFGVDVDESKLADFRVIPGAGYV